MSNHTGIWDGEHFIVCPICNDSGVLDEKAITILEFSTDMEKGVGMRFEREIAETFLYIEGKTAEEVGFPEEWTFVLVPFWWYKDRYILLDETVEELGWAR